MYRGINKDDSAIEVHWEIRERMCEPDIEMIVQRAFERFPDHKPRLISDNGSQFIARDFKLFVRLTGMQHVRTSPYYPQSNDKLERWHQTLKQLAIRPKTPFQSPQNFKVQHHISPAKQVNSPKI